MQGVVLAAGKGTRLAPLTPARSKAMAPVAGKPLVGRIIDALADAGVGHLVIVAAADDVGLHHYVETEVAPTLPVQIVVQTARLGMAHALRLAAPFLDGNFVMSACDNLVPQAHLDALVAAHRARTATATLSLMPVALEQVSKTGIVVWDDPWVRRIVEKPAPAQTPSTISSLPLYVFGPAILPLVEQVQPSSRGEYELQDAIQALIDHSNRVTGVFTASRRQVTDLADLLALNLRFLDDGAHEQDGRQPHVAGHLGPDVALSTPVYIAAGASVGASAQIGPRVYIEEGATVGAGACLRDAVVLRGGVVADGEQVQGRIVLPHQA